MLHTACLYVTTRLACSTSTSAFQLDNLISRCHTMFNICLSGACFVARNRSQDWHTCKHFTLLWRKYASSRVMSMNVGASNAAVSCSFRALARLFDPLVPKPQVLSFSKTSGSACIRTLLRFSSTPVKFRLVRAASICRQLCCCVVAREATQADCENRPCKAYLTL